MAVTTVVSTLNTIVCGSPSHSTIPLRSVISTRIHLWWNSVPSACMKAFMQHFQSARFLEEVSRLAAAPRRSSTNHMYNHRWFRFAHWAAEQGIDKLGPTVAQIAQIFPHSYSWLIPSNGQGYRSCLTSVLSHTCRPADGQDRIILNIISSKLQRPRLTPILP